MVVDGLEGESLTGSNALHSPEVLRVPTMDTRSQSRIRNQTSPTGDEQTSGQVSQEGGDNRTSSSRLRDEANKVAEALEQESMILEAAR